MCARERFPRLYKDCFVPLCNRCGISQSTFLWGPVSLLALVPLSNQCGTPPNPPCSVPNVLVGTLPRVHPPFLAQRPCWHTPSCPPPSRLSLLAGGGSVSSLAHHPMSGSNTICISPNPPLAYIVFFGLSLLDFPSRF